jgi:hypothetical protein
MEAPASLLPQRCPETDVARKRLTDRTLKALPKADPGSRYDLMDTDVPGLGVRVNDKGLKTFVLLTRYPGSPNPTRRALGEYGAMSLEAARQKARHWQELIRRGVDPKDEEERVRRSENERRENSFAKVVADSNDLCWLAIIRTSRFNGPACIRREISKRSSYRATAADLSTASPPRTSFLS